MERASLKLRVRAIVCDHSKSLLACFFFTVFGSIETKKFRIIRQKKQYLNAYTGRRWLVLLAEVSSFATRINLYCQHNDSVAGDITQCER